MLPKIASYASLVRSPYPYGGHNQGLVLEAFHNLGVGFREVPRELDSPLVVPGSHPLQPVLLQLDDLEGEVGPEPALVELHLAGEPVHLDQLHVVDQRVAVLPGLLSRAAEGPGDDHLNINIIKCVFYLEQTLQAKCLPEIGRVRSRPLQKSGRHHTSEPSPSVWKHY